MRAGTEICDFAAVHRGKFGDQVVKSAWGEVWSGCGEEGKIIPEILEYNVSPPFFSRSPGHFPQAV